MAKGSSKKAPIDPIVDDEDEPAWDPKDCGDVSIPFLIEAARKEGLYVYDLETTGLNPRKDRIEGAAFYVPNDNDPSRPPLRAWFPFVEGTMDYAVGGEIISVRPPLELASTMDGLRELWSIPDLVAVRHNGVFDDAFLYKANGTDKPIIVQNKIADSMLADYVADERHRKYGLKIRVWEVFNHRMTTYEEAAGKQGVFSFARKRPLGAYAMDDTTWTHRLFKWAIDSIRKQDPAPEGRDMGHLERIFWNIEMKIQRILLEMELQGCLIDWEWLVGVEQRLEKDKLRIIEQIQSQKSWVPNLRSPKQVSDFLYGKEEDGGLGLPTDGLDDTWNDDQETWSTADKVIARFGKREPIVDLLLKYRSLEVISRSFCQKLIGLAQEEGRIHARFRQTGTVIGRLSCIAKGTYVDVVRDLSVFTNGIRIEDVRPGDLAFTYDDDLKLTLRPVRRAWMTGHRHVVRVHWRGTGHRHTGFVDMTPEHCVRLIDGSYRKAEDLVSGDRCLALSRNVSSYPYSHLYPTGQPEIKAEHRWIFETLNGRVGDNHVHHKDGNKLNNQLSNLESLTPGDHTGEHAKEMWKRPETRKAITSAVTERWKNADYRQRHHKHMKRMWKDGKFVKPSGRDHPQFKELSKEWLEAELWRHAGHPALVARTHTINFDRLKKFIKDYGIDIKIIQLLHRSDGTLITKEQVAEARDMTNQRKAQKFLGVNFYKFKALQEHFGFAPAFNHVIERVEVLPDPVDVYDLEIEGTHNFIAGELDVHNSADPINLMNQPREKNLVRRSFCSRLPNTSNPEQMKKLFIDADYMQMELRMAAHLAQEPSMLEVYRNVGGCHNGKEGDGIPNGGPCDRYLHFECMEDKGCKTGIPKEVQGVKVCAFCGSPRIKHQERCRHVDLHQRTSEDVGVKRNPLAKCLDGSTLLQASIDYKTPQLLTIEGLFKTACRDAEPGHHSSVYDGASYEVADGRGGRAALKSGLVRFNRPTKIIVTKRSVVIATEDHRFQAIGDFKSLDPATPGYQHVAGMSLVEAQALEKGMKLPLGDAAHPDAETDEFHRRRDPICVRINPFTKEVGDGPAKLELDESWAYFAGIFAGDGCASGNACVITHGHTDEYAAWRDTVHRACDAVGLPTSVSGDRRSTRIGSRVVRGYLSGLDLCKEIGVSGEKTMRVPEWVLRGGPSIMWSYLAGVFDTDGTVGKKNNGTASMTTKYPEYAGQIALMLRFLGMPILVQPGFNKTYETWYYTVHVLGAGLRHFLKYCPLRFKEKAVRLQERVDTIKRECAPKDDEVLLVLDGGERTVYDFQIDNDDHLYLQGGLIGHNNLNFGLLYRMGAPKFVIYADLFDENGLPRTEYAEELIEKWHAAYPGIVEWHKKVLQQLKADKFIAYALTRRRRRLEAEWKNPKTQYRAGTQAIQFKVSGSCQELIKLAMIKIFEERNKRLANAGPAEAKLWDQFRFMIQVHDELVFEGREELEHEIKHIIKTNMEGVASGLSVPFLADVRAATNWDQTH
jgi:DNA polymerase I-like protein with 3'-5' exonuclease and polymerase domains